MAELHKNFPYNCGIGVIGEFPELNPANYQFDEARKELFKTLLAKAIPLVQAEIETEIHADQNPETDDEGNTDYVPKKVYLATTSERQPSAIEALRNLGFIALTKWQGCEGEITLWFRTAKSL